MIKENGEYINFMYEGLVVTHIVYRLLWRIQWGWKHYDFEAVYFSWMLR